MKSTVICHLLTVVIGSIPAVAWADYTVLLKNGRRIAVQSYRDEGNVIKFHGFGGEIAIAKDQVKSITEIAREPSGTGSSQTDAAAASRTQQIVDPATGTRETTEKPVSSEEAQAKEEQDYQRRLRAVTERLIEVRNRFSQSTRGTVSQEPALLTSEEEMGKLDDDAAARRLDAQTNPVDPGVLRLLTPSPFTSLPPDTLESRLRPAAETQRRDFSTSAANETVAPGPGQPTIESQPPVYTTRQKELSELRNEAIRLETERERLIDEMKQKNFTIGSLFAD